MDRGVYVKTFAAEDLPVNKRELWRYAGYTGIPADEDLLAAAAEVRAALAPQLSLRVVWRQLPVTAGEAGLLSPLQTPSRGLQRCLAGCSEAVVMAATIGLAPDRYIARYGRTSPLRALLAQAYGAERIEALCDAFCAGFPATPRFSPGYGDLPLDAQRQVFSLLDCSRRIGLSLNGSLLMSPSKSVTAVFGLREADTAPAPAGCAVCGKNDCGFRKEVSPDSGNKG